MEVPPYASGGENFYEARIVRSPSISGMRSIDVNCRALDSLFGHLKSIDFVKCDVEGHELKVLEGASRTLKERRIRDLIFEDLGAVQS
jgi:FkbM family methyltransferase